MTDSITIARSAIGALLDGKPPVLVGGADLGKYHECYGEMLRAHAQGGTEPARLVYVTYAERDHEIAAIRASDPQTPRIRYKIDELYDMTFDDPVWVVPDYLPEGEALLIARPKIGKSWMGLQLCAAVGSGGMFLGQRVERAPVLYFALEDKARRMNDRARKQQIPRDADVEFVHRWESLMGKGATDLQREVETGGYKLVIIDTLGRAFGGCDLVKDGAKVSERLAALQDWALEKHVALLFIHHSRKASSGDAVDDVLGATGIAGNADAVWSIKRERGQRDATFTITGRDVEERELAIKFDAQLWCWQSMGSADAVRQETVQGRILAALATMADNQATPVELGKHLNVFPENIARELGELLTKGLVEKAGKRGRNVYYQLVTVVEK